MRRRLLILACAVLSGLAAYAQPPKADVLDIVFNDDGTVVDASPMKNPVIVTGAPRIVESTQFDMNVLCQSDELWGAELPNFIRVDANEALEAAIADGATFETMIRPYFAGGVFNREWVNLFGGFQGGGIGIIIYNGVYDFEAYIGGGYVDVVNNFSPVANEWVHLMGVWNKETGDMKLFINGKLEGALQGVSGDISFASREDRFYALGCDLEPGNSYHSGNAFTGDIALARIYDKPLSDEEVAAVYADIASRECDCGEHVEKAVLRQDADGTVLIATTDELAEFGRAVRLGESGLNARLEADVAYPAGYKMLSTDAGYRGDFDGQGHTITLGMEMSGHDAALFKYLSGARIHDLNIAGDIATSSKYAAGLAGHATGSNTVSRVHSSVNITSTIEGDGTHGGFIGSNSSGDLLVEDCLFDGSITGGATTSCAGIVGWSGGNTYIQNTLLTAEIATAEDDCYTFSRNPGNARVSNSYYLLPYGAVNAGAVQIDEIQLSNGEACWLLNGSKVSDHWRQTLPEDVAPTLQAGHGIVVNMDGDIRSIQDDASLKSVADAYSTYLSGLADQIEAFKPLVDELKFDIGMLAAATSVDLFLNASGKIDDDFAAIDKNLEAYESFEQLVENTEAEIEGLENPVAQLLRTYLTESLEPNDNFRNGSAVYILENFVLGTDELAEEGKWINEMLQNALSNDVPVGSNITLLLANADFSSGDAGWTGTNATNYTYNPNAGQWYGVMEGVKTQTITGLKNGIYEFRLNSFNMVGDDSYCSFYTGVILANDVEIPVMSPMEDPVSVQDAVDGVNCYGNDRLVDDQFYIPYSRVGGAVAFSAGRYPNSVMVEVTDGTLTVGFHLYGSGRNDDWFMFANAQLYYQGTAQEASEALDGVLAGAIARAQTTIAYEADVAGTRFLYFPNYSQALRTELAAAVEAAQAAADGPAKYAALVELSDLFKQIYACRKAYREMAVDLVSYYERIPDYPDFADVIQKQADEAWDSWLAGTYSADEAVAKGKALLAEMDGYAIEVPVADLLDIVFNSDGTATDISPAKSEIVPVGEPKIVQSAALGMNVYCHTNNSWGGTASTGFKVFPSDAMFAGIEDGLTIEVLTRPYWEGDVVPGSWATVAGMEQGGGFGMLVYGSQWDFEAHVGGGYQDVYSGFAPVKSEWVHLIGVWSQEESMINLYVDGILVGSIPGGGGYGQPGAPSIWFGIGGDLSSSGDIEASYNGDIALVRLYDKPVNSSQAALLYKNAKALFTGQPEHKEDGDAISTLSPDAPARPQVYTITGLRVDKPVGKGIYIVNGKKVLIK